MALVFPNWRRVILQLSLRPPGMSVAKGRGPTWGQRGMAETIAWAFEQLTPVNGITRWIICKYHQKLI